MSLSSFHGSRLPASAPGIWRPRLPTRDTQRYQQRHRTRCFLFFLLAFISFPFVRHTFLHSFSTRSNPLLGQQVSTRACTSSFTIPMTARLVFDSIVFLIIFARCKMGFIKLTLILERMSLKIPGAHGNQVPLVKSRISLLYTDGAFVSIVQSH